MPAHRNMPERRSRRISKQEPRVYDDLWENFELMYPDMTEPSDIAISPTTIIPTSSTLYPSSSASPDSSSDAPRISHSRRRPKGHVCRPPNAFMLFRSDFWAKEKQKVEPIERDHRDISRIAAHCWHNLDEDGKIKYRKLAEQRKQLHRLEHPDYKYSPVTRREKVVKKKTKRGSLDEEERCKMLASLVMGGVAAADLGEAMKKIVKKEESVDIPIPALSPSPSQSPPQSRRIHNPQDHAQIRLTPPRSFKVESPAIDLFQYDQSFEYLDLDVSLDASFVRTEDIPPLDLSAVKKEEKFDMQFDHTIRPMGYDSIDSQFGFKSEIAHYAPDQCFWYSPSGALEDEFTSGVPIPAHAIPDHYSINNTVPQFTNPFASLELSELGSVYAEHQQALNDFFPPALDHLPHDNYDINQFFRFDDF